MLTQADYDKISSIKEQDFITIMTAVEGGVDWEQMVIVYAKSLYEYAIKLMRDASEKGQEWDQIKDAVKSYDLKADKLICYLNVFRKLNA